MKRKLHPYKCNNFILRLLERKDIDFVLSWRNHQSHRIWFKNSSVISKKEHYTWFQMYLQNENDFIFLVTDADEIKYGQVSIYNAQWLNHEAEFGRVLANPMYENQGFMKKACKITLSLAKEILNLKRLTLQVKYNNYKAIYIYQQCGFVVSKLNGDMVNMEIYL